MTNFPAVLHSIVYDKTKKITFRQRLALSGHAKQKQREPVLCVWNSLSTVSRSFK